MIHPVRRALSWGGGGGLGGIGIAGAEAFVNYVSGGVIPLGAVTGLAAAYGVLGAIYGALLGVLTGGWEGEEDVERAALVAAGIFGYGLLRIYQPPGWRAEALYLAGCIGLFGLLLRLRLCALSPSGWRGTAQCLSIALGAVIGGSFVAEEVLRLELRGVALLASFVLLPLVALAGQRSLFALGRRRRAVADRPFLFFLLEAGVVVGCALAWATPAVLHPLEAPEAAEAPQRSSPNVVLISLDTVRADHLSVYGYTRPTAPHLEALARESALFRNCISTSAWTLPSHASMFTGLFPRTHGARLAGDYLAQKDVEGRRLVAFPLAETHATLAEILRRHGYATGAVVANFSYLFRDFGLARGFDLYDDAPAFLFRYRPHLVLFLQKFSPSFFLKPYRSAEEINREAFAWLGRHAQRPFFLFVNYMEAHHPWGAPAPYDRWVKSGPSPPFSHVDLYTHEVKEFSPAEQEVLAAHYDGALAYEDEQVGRLLAELRRLGVYDNSLIIVVGDHGELLGEHGLIGHMGRMLYEGLVRVPLLIRYPHAALTGDFSAPVQVLDLMPTILDTVGVPLPAGLQGQVLPRVTHEIVVEEFINRRLAERYGKRYDREIRALYLDGYKLISTSQGELELYRLQSDPGEEDNLAAKEEGVARRYADTLKAWEATHPLEVASHDGRTGGEAAARLKALGYVQ